jgi:hypothetical protein
MIGPENTPRGKSRALDHVSNDGSLKRQAILPVIFSVYQ